MIEKMAKLKLKVMFISGDEDHCFIEDVKELAKKMRNTEITIIEKCGHICSIEKWSVFNRVVLDFLSRNISNTRIAESK